MSYQHSVEQLYALGHELANTPSNKFDLTYVREMLAAFDHPERRFRSVLIAGTNGKGSTAATLSSILRVAGYKTALYSSPHLVRINERLRLDDVTIADEDFAAVHDRVEATAQTLLQNGTLPWHPSFFEMLTVMAFLYFAEAHADIAVLEVGMGGRLDATNVVEPLISIITDISLDHQKFLGDTIAEIAFEKAGIIRENGLAVLLPQHPEANEVLGRVILEKNARAVSAAQYVPPIAPGAGVYLSGRPILQDGHNRYPLTVMGEEIDIDCPRAGRHQLGNIALAITAAEQLGAFGFTITPRQVQEGICQIHWPGRFQVLAPSPMTHQREVVLDVAHNPAGAWALRSALSGAFPERRLILVFAALRDKAVQEICEILFPLAECAVVTHLNTPRASPIEELLQAGRRTGIPVMAEPSVPLALLRAWEFADPGDVVVVTGSIYLVGEAITAMQLSV